MNDNLYNCVRYIHKQWQLVAISLTIYINIFFCLAHLFDSKWLIITILAFVFCSVIRGAILVRPFDPKRYTIELAVLEVWFLI
jgi:hypothetical protein